MNLFEYTYCGNYNRQIQNLARIVPEKWSFGDNDDNGILVTWSVKDAMNDEMESYFNSDYQESYVITPVTTFHLTPDTEKPFSMDNFPERFSQWLTCFIKLITNNF